MAHAIDVLKAQLVRSSTNEDWGIRLQGGVDTGAPIVIHRITPGSPAHRIGLNNHDAITFIEDTPTDHLTYDDALRMMQRMGDTMVLTVERKSWGRPPTQPVMRSTAPQQPKFYQPMDMSGGKVYPSQPQNYPVSFEPSYEPTPEPQPSYQQPAYAETPRYYNGHSTSSPHHPHQAHHPHHPHQPHHPNHHHQQHPHHHIPSYPTPSSQPTDSRFYQTYDLNGPRHYVPSEPQTNVEFRIAKPKLFEEPVRPPHRPPAAPQAPVEPHLRDPPRTSSRDAQKHQFSPPPPNVYRAGPVRVVPEEDKLDDDTSQSRTFKILRSLMANEEPYSGVDGLPPPRSAEMERMKEDYAKQNPKARVKVFMPQQYNSPMGMYSPENVMESFHTQAEGYFDDLDRKEMQASEQTLSNTAKVVLEQEMTSTSDF